MNNIILFIACFLCSSFSDAQEKKKYEFILENEFYKMVKQPKLTLVLISSMNCGYCIMDIEFNNDLVNRYSSERISFVMLMQEDYDFLVHNSYFQKISNKWSIVSSSGSIQKKIWKKEIYPEVHIFMNGKLIKSFVDASDRTKKRLVAYLDKFLIEN